MNRRLESWGYEAETFLRELRDHMDGYRRWNAQVNVLRPCLGLELDVRFVRQKGAHGWFTRWLKREDPEIGVQEFDDNVFIEVISEYEQTTRAMLENAGLREAILWLVGAGCTMSLVGRDMTVGAIQGVQRKLPDVADIARYTLALAIHMDRFARANRR